MMIFSKRYYDPYEFLQLVSPWLLKAEAENNLPLGILSAAVQEGENPAHFFAATFQQGELVFTMIQTTKNLIVAGKHDVIGHSVEFLLSEGLEVNRVIGPYETGIAFAREYEHRTARGWKLEMEQRIYKLEKLFDVPLAAGNLRQATNDDQEIILPWLQGFYQVIGEYISTKQADNAFRQYLGEGSLYVWEDGEVVSMIRKTRPSQNGIVISHVFTPEKFRGKGYATTCVYMFSRMLLEEYSFCSLYTDLSNPTSNRIYSNIGYQPVADSVWVNFVK